ncbi:hypothetical protein [Schlesneria sp. T3-172]|uniref:hypothetical protein n=1 Tax=Schlesneria sphaerica TaxID=3373610 RepID=UPI0037C97947
MAIKRWLGNAAAIADVWTISLSGTVISQIYTVTINSKTVQYVADGAATVSTVLAGLRAALSAISPSPPVEFTELTAATLPTVGPFTSLTLTGNTPGKPHTISVGTSGAASFSITNTTPATGPNDFKNALNWSGGVAPANSDTLVFDNGSVACKYGLSTTLTGIVVSVERGYSGQIGLPFINSDNSTTTYAEYRPTSLTLDGGTLICNSADISRCNLDFGSTDAVIRVLNSGVRADQGTPVVLITGGDSATELDVTKGDVGVAFYQGTTAEIPSIKSGFAASPLSDASIIVGPGATLDVVEKNGGYFGSRSDVVTLSQGVAGGVVDLHDAVEVTTINCYAGTVNLNTTGTIGTINLYGKSTLNADGDPRAKTITNPINVYAKDVTINDNQKSINSGTLTLATNGATTVNVGHGANATMEYT